MRAPTENKLSSPFLRLVVRAFNMQLMTVAITLIIFVLATYGQDKGWFTERGALTVTTVIGFLVHFFLEYKVFWGIGERDRNLVIYHHLEEHPLRGLWAGCTASVPMIFAVAAYIMDCSRHFLSVGETLVCRMYALQYIGFFQLAAEHPANAWLLAFTCLYMPLLCGIGYRNGYRLVEVGTKLVYKKK